jgi:exosome complex exonuclease DIS3/RRP44
LRASEAAAAQLDFLESPQVNDVVVLTVVLEEARRGAARSPLSAALRLTPLLRAQVRKRNVAAYNRLRALCCAPGRRFFVFANEHHCETHVSSLPGESPNDRNDRAIRTATAFYARVCPTVKVLLLTQDAANRTIALQQGLSALSVADYARSRAAAAPELADLVAGGGGGEAEGCDEAALDDNARPAKRARLYSEHLPLSELTRALKEGRVHQGALRVSRFNAFEAWVGSDAVGCDILISGRTDTNRALDGDIVAVELLPEAQWKRVSSHLPGGGGGAGEGPSADGGEAEEGQETPDAALLQVAPGEHYGDDGGLGAASAAGEGARPTGRVVGIIRRNWRTRGYCGSLEEPRAGAEARRAASGAATHALFVPVERRFPKVRLRTRQAQALLGMRVVVAIDEWDACNAYPTGHYVRTLGPCGDKETETEVLVHEHDIDTRPFSEAVHACVPPLPWSVPAEALSDPQRADLRHLRVCSVDPPGCRDIDDALHARRTPGGAWEVGVHIADVTAFLSAGNAMDEEASRRGTSTYLVQRRIDMLPKALTEDICSLRGGTERLTFSVLWEMDDDANVLAVRFTKAVIRSSAALSYQEAQARMDDPGARDPLTCDLRALSALAKKLRRKRAAAGALVLASPEVKFQLDSETLDPLDVGMYEVREANQMVEEFMLLANCTVADKVLAHFPACALLRRHPVPTPRMLAPLLKAAEAAGVTLDVSSSASLGASLDAARRVADPYFNKLLRILATRCMTQAVYFASGDLAPAEYLHYGLAAPLYTHFTSPIRRYADVVVHRLLAAALGLCPLPAATADVKALSGVSDNLNTRHRNAQQAGRSSVELHTLLFFRGRTVVADARVTRCRANGLIVFVPKYGIEGPLLFPPDSGAWLLAPDGAAVSCAAQRFALFDRVAVRISVEVSPVARRERLMLQVAQLAEIGASEVAKP